MTLPTSVPRKQGLGSYLALAFSVISILMAAVLIVVSERTATRQARQIIGTNLAELANQTTSRLDRSMFERHREVRLLAARLSQGADSTRTQAELEDLQRTYPYYAWIGVTDPAGKVVTATGGLLAGMDVSKRPWFANAYEDRHMGDVHDAVLLAKLLAREGAEPMRFVDIAFALKGETASRGVLAVHLSWDWARDVKSAIFVQVGSARDVEPLIVSKAGVVLLGPADVLGRTLTLPSLDAAASGPPGYVTERWPDGRRYLVGYSRDHGYRDYPGLGWRVLVRQGLDSADEPVAQLQSRLVAWGIGAALSFSLLGWVGARLIMRPVRRLTRAARRIEGGQAGFAVPSAPYREVAELGTALDSLVRNLRLKDDDLRELNASLEQKVAQRTADLHRAFERLRSNEQRIRTIIDMAPDPFVGVDFQGKVTDWNTRAQDLFGWHRDEVLGRPLSEVLLPPRFRDVTDAALALFAADGQAPFVGRSMERLVVDRKGRELPVELTIGLIDTGNLKLFSAFVRDIGARKEVERLKNEFISTVSHELRTPLTAIYGSLSLLDSGVAGELPAGARELVSMSSLSCDRLVRLINDVLDVEKIGSRTMDYQLRPQALAGLVQQAIRDTQPYADGFRVGLRLTTAIAGSVMADADRIVQVMVNLLSNAAKFSPPGAQVEVAMHQREDGWVRVSVIDRGPGLPESFRARAFERFAQADASDRRQRGGSGLGLNICRSIVQAHQGTIDYHSEPGVRTEFFFDLPLLPA